MNNSQTSSEREPSRPAQEQKSARKSFLLLTAIVGLMAIALVVFTARHTSTEKPVPPPAPNDPVPEISTPNNPTVEVNPPVEDSNTESVAFPPYSERLTAARELVKRLSEVELPPSPESAAKWQKDLESLVEQGTAAVPPLREFFQSHADVRFDSGSGTNLLEEPTLRMAFIEVLFNIPTPDNVDLQVQLLHETTDPEEVALLARQLEQQEPGKYRELIVWAVQTSLQQVQTGQWPGRKTTGLINVLNKYQTPASN